jgi:hypothetical protein
MLAQTTYINLDASWKFYDALLGRHSKVVLPRRIDLTAKQIKHKILAERMAVNGMPLFLLLWIRCITTGLISRYKRTWLFLLAVATE